MSDARPTASDSFFSPRARPQCEVDVESTPEGRIEFARAISVPGYVTRFAPIDAVVVAMTVRGPGEVGYDLGSGNRVLINLPEKDS